MNGIWKTTLKRFVHDFQGFTKDKEVARINKAVTELANKFDLSVDEDDIDQLIEVVPEELTNEELLGVEREYIAEGEAREKNYGKKKQLQNKKEPLKNFTVKCLAEAFADLNNIL